PFFVNQFLIKLNELQKFHFDPSSESWHWKLPEIKNLEISGNVAELMAEKIGSLAKTSKTILKNASCLGASFQLSTLALVSNMSPTDTADTLKLCINSGLVQAIGDDYKYVAEFNLNEDEQAQTTLDAITYRFVHDRIQQAAYGLLEEEEKTALHFKIANILWEKEAHIAESKNLFIVANQMLLGLGLVTGLEFRLKVAHLFYLAGIRSKAAAAFDPAVQFFRSSFALIKEKPFEQDFTFSMYLGLAQSLFAQSLFDEPREIYLALLEQSQDRYQKAEVYDDYFILENSNNRFAQSLEICVAALSLFGIKIPDKVYPWHFLVDLLKAASRAGKTDWNEVFAWPESQDKDYIWSLKFLSNLAGPCFMTGDENKMALAHVLGAKLTFKKQELAPISPSNLINFAIMITVGLGKHEVGYNIGQFALRLCADRYDDPHVRGITQFMFHSFISFWRNHQLDAKPLWNSAYQSSMQAGNLVYAAYGNNRMAGESFYGGIPLPQIVTLCDEYKNFYLNNDLPDMKANISLFRQFSDALSGNTLSPLDWNQEEFNEEVIWAQFQDHNYISGQTVFTILKTWGHFLMGDLTKAVDFAAQTQTRIKSVFGMPEQMEFVFLQAMIDAQDLPNRGFLKRFTTKIAIRAKLKKLASWAKESPLNFEHRYLLARGMFHESQNQLVRAAMDFENSIISARKSQQNHIEALSLERAGELQMKRGFLASGESLLKQAHKKYLFWGARPKAKAITEKFAEFDFEEKDISGTHSFTSSIEGLDAISIVKASTHLAESILLEDILQGLIDIAVENAGANYGVFLLEEDGVMNVQAILDLKAGKREVMQSIALSQFKELCHPVVNKIILGEEAILLRNAAEYGEYTSDPYIIAQKTPSVLAIPIRNQGRLRGVIYLENRLVSAAFTNEHVVVLKLLTSQMVKTIENAYLYKNLQAAHDDLEEKVIERTKELNTSLTEVSAAKDKIMESITYANQIQKSLLPREDFFNQLLPNNFVIWKPRDVVGGDFYQIYKVEGGILLIVADCTGHGVPGALMTMIAASAIRQFVVNEKIREPKELLSRVNLAVKLVLSQNRSDSLSDDGLDAAVCFLPTGNKEIIFSGAKLDLFYQEKGKINRVKGKNQSLGYRRSKDDFDYQQHIIPVESGAHFYLTTDGIIDQEGGAKGFPYNNKKLTALLEEALQLPIEKQSEFIFKIISEYRGLHSRTDDMAMVGFSLDSE
ncbi:MAG: SpoIIE family protein phosphatase, partial [SAR324 cluster bacterium]|nr:SpoIIE family protein phosphatase [SAR324 cluster bacterium]